MKPMPNYQSMEQQLTQHLGLSRRPVAVTYGDAVPDNVTLYTGTQPAGCSFWGIAAGGKTFYTQPSDHYNCPIGSYTHHIDLPSERASELEETLGLMVQIGYLKMEEVPGVFRLPKTPHTVTYSPLGETPLDPSVVVVSGRPNQLALLAEASLRAGVYSSLPMLARPTCMALPAALEKGVVISTACIGNRVYTDLSGDELYAVIPGKDVDRVVAELETIATANAKLAEHHRARRHALATA
jgi:uncharacterized protein (DUF169 family)